MYGCKKWHSISEATCKYCGRTFVPGDRSERAWAGNEVDPRCVQDG